MIALNQNRPEKAASLLAWADATRLELNNQRPPIEQNQIALKTVELETELDEATLSAARAVGAALNLEAAIVLAFENN